MTMLRARLPRLLVLLCAGLVLSSCVTMAVESNFEGDGPATHSMTFTIDTSSLGSLGQDIDPTEGLDEAQQEAEQEGYRVEPIQDGDVVGLRISTEVEDSSDLGAVLNNLYNAQSPEEAGEPIEPFTGTFSESDGTYRLELTVNGDELVQGAGQDLGEGQAPQDFGFDLATIFDMTYTANMPGEIDEDETNGEILDDGRVQWELPLTGTETLVAVSSGDEDDSNLWVWALVGGIILFGLILIAIVVFVLFMSRRNRTPATADAGYPEASPGSAPPAQPFGQAPAPATGPAPPPSPPPTWSESSSASSDVPPADQPTRPMPPASDREADTEDDRPDRPAF